MCISLKYRITHRVCSIACMLSTDGTRCPIWLCCANNVIVEHMLIRISVCVGMSFENYHSLHISSILPKHRLKTHNTA